MAERSIPRNGFEFLSEHQVEPWFGEPRTIHFRYASERLLVSVIRDISSLSPKKLSISKVDKNVRLHRKDKALKLIMKCPTGIFEEYSLLNSLGRLPRSGGGFFINRDADRNIEFFSDVSFYLTEQEALEVEVLLSRAVLGTLK